jgi:glucoamylase
MDLDYIVANWRKPCYDLWEETFGQHFFTRMVERKALLDAADFLEGQGQGKNSKTRFYRAEALALSREIEKHWDLKKKIILPTIDQTNMPYKKSGLDSSVILGVLMGQTEDGFFAPEDGRVLATVEALENSFKTLYAINRAPNAPGIAIGRYPEDRYNGTDVFKSNNGNPWVLNTEAFSQFYSALIRDYRKKGEITVTGDDISFFNELLLGKKAHFNAGEQISSSNPLFEKIMGALAQIRNQYMNVVRFYANKDGTLSEQIDRRTGAMASAPNLTWNYAAFLSQDRERR